LEKLGKREIEFDVEKFIEGCILNDKKILKIMVSES
jgi:hypothetical protein